MRLPFLKNQEERAFPALSFDEWVNFFNYGGHNYELMPSQTLQGDRESIDPSFAGYVRGAYKGNGVIFACMLARMLLFSEARFQFTQMDQGRRGKLFGTRDLEILETPWPNGTTGDLLTKMIQHVDLAGNAFVAKRPNQLKVLRPDWVDIVHALEDESNPLDSELIGYAYYPGGKQSGNDPIMLLPEQVAHWAPLPDPEASFRGMSWLSPVLRETMADGAMTDHKLKFFENGATSNMIVKVPEGVRKEAFDALIATFKAKHEGVQNAYKTLFLTSGADATVVGSNFEQMDFKTVQGAGETRIAAAAGVPPVIVGLSEGLAAATYSNYELAMRRFVDLTMRPLWRNVAGSLAGLVNVPTGSNLWYDDRDVPALHENAMNAAQIDQVKSQTIHTLITSGFNPDDVIAVVNPEWTQLQHTGLFSVQLQPAGTVGEGKGSVLAGTPVPTGNAPEATPPPKNGKTPTP